jgi:hypothetical protein
MTKAELLNLLQRIAVSDNAKSKCQLIMQSMTPLVHAHRNVGDGRVIEHVQLAIADGERRYVAPLSITYIIGDPAIIEVAWRRAFAGRLQLEPSTKIEGDDATIASGVIALLSERPVLTLTAIGDDTLEMRIGGFDKSRIVHPGTLMDLSRQMVEAKKDS